MANNKYIFDPESLTYIPVEVSFKDRAKKLLPYIGTGALLGAAVYVFIAFSNVYATPREKMQAEKLRVMEKNHVILNNKIIDANNTLQSLVELDDSLYRVMLGEEALAPSLRQAGTGGSDKYSELIKMHTPEDIINSYKQLDALVAKMNVQQGSYKELFKKTVANQDRLQHLPAIIPIANWDLTRIGSGFSPRRFHPILKRWRQHEGIDFIAPKGTEVFASADGQVVSVRRSDSFGQVVEIDHGHGITSLYAHLSKFKTKRGAKVKRGELIGLVGNTGLSAGPHLHYEVHLNNKEVDPVNYFFNDLTAEEYKAVVARAESITECME